MLIHDFLYVVEVYDEPRKPHSPGLIERRLWSCVRDVERRLASGERAKPVGILSTDDRDRWTEVRLPAGQLEGSLTNLNASELRQVAHLVPG